MRERGQAFIIIILIILVLALVGLFAICTPGEDDHSLGRIQLVSHDRGCDPDYDDCGEEDGGRRDKRTCFFGCDNIIVIPNPIPGGDQPEPPRERTSLVPPTPDKIIQGFQTMADAGINLGTTIARLVVDYVVTVFRFIV